MKIINVLWIIIGAICATVSVSFVKIYTKTKNIQWIILAMASFLLLIYAYSVVLKNEKIIIVYPILKIVSILFVVFVGCVFFKNKLDLKISIGVLLGLVSIYLLSMEE
jgi:multidrug transporter EmrE-like cation transporter